MDEVLLGNSSENIDSNKPTNVRPLLESLDDRSILRKRRRRKTSHRNETKRLNDDKIDNSPGNIETGRSTVDIRQPTSEHLMALEKAFNKILNDRTLTDTSFKQRQTILNKLKELVLKTRPDCQINLYGSLLFECCLEKPGIMDIDIQFKETFQHDTLKELIEIITKNDLCKEARINTEHKPSCIDLITNEPNIRVRITSGYNRGINLSRLIQIYTKFDSRVIKLLRLFRIFSKTCNIDQPDSGTLHPIVFHIMIIHFLQQIVPPVLPCLHEYIYGINHVPLTLNDSEYSEFFRLSNEYSHQWKSTNSTSIEMLFLQLFSYYVENFNSKQFVVSIQTRMPVVKIDKNWHSRKLLVEDPSDIKRSLCQTMQAMRSINYFRDILNTGLNYFGRKQKKIKKCQSNQCSTNENDDFIEIIVDDENDIPIIDPNNSLHNSYELFYKILPDKILRDVNIRQNRVRDFYKKTFTKKLPQPIINLNRSNNEQNENFDENDIVEAFQHDLEHNFETMDANDDELNTDFNRIISINDNEYDENLPTDFNQFDNENKQNQSIIEDLSSSINNEEKSDETNQLSLIITDNEQGMKNSQDKICSNSNNKNVDGNKFHFDKLLENLNKKQRRILNREYERQGNVINENVIKVYENFKPPSSKDETETIDVITPVNEPKSTENQQEIPVPNEQLTNQVEQTLSTDDSSSEFFYDFQAENFHAEQGAPPICTICNGVGHLKSECPELFVPDMIDLPQISQQWMQILSALCSRICERSQPTSFDIQTREKILKQLHKQFEKDYPDCNLHAFGSFYNGFGFRESDLDVCIVFKDQRENTEEFMPIMRKILKSMRSNGDVFENVQPVLHAKVPIIRSTHRRSCIAIDISFHNMLAIENTRLLNTYTKIDPRVSQIGYMIKHLAKLCNICDASRGTLSSYAYIIMVIHFLQQIQPPVLPVLQQFHDTTKKESTYKKCSKWNVYFYDDLNKINKLWKKENSLSPGALWIEFLRYYTEQFNYDENVVTIRQIQPLSKHNKGWFRQTISIEDPFELTHNLAGGLSIRNWTLIRRVFTRARQQFGLEQNDIDNSTDLETIELTLFNIDELCPTNAPKRCSECKGPYHIRKRCPKLISLADEKEKAKQLTKFEQQQKVLPNNQYGFYPNNSQIAYYVNDYYRVNEFQYHNSFQMLHQQRFWAEPYSNENQLFCSNFNYYPTDQRQRNNSNYLYHPNNSQKKCFVCGSPNHLRAQCSRYQANGVHR